MRCLFLFLYLFWEKHNLGRENDVTAQNRKPRKSIVSGTFAVKEI